MQISYTAQGQERTIECERFVSMRGEGVNGPYILEFFDGVGEEETLIAAVSRVEAFEILPPE